MKTLSTLILTLVVSVIVFGCAPNAGEGQLQEFVTAHVEKIKPMEKEAKLAYWDAAVTGKSADYDKYSKLMLGIRQVYSDPQEFAFLEEMKESGEVKKAILARQLDALYNGYLENQIEPQLLKRIVDLGTEIEKNFSTFRGTIEGKKVTGNEIGNSKNTDGFSGEKAGVAGQQAGRSRGCR
jgi:peptidyl-dipeptidase A